MKNIKLEFFDIYNHKQTISISASKKDELFKNGFKIDASDVLGLMFVCDADFFLKPVICPNKKTEDVYFCRVYDEEGNALDVHSKKWIDLLNYKTIQWNQFTANIQSNVFNKAVL